MNHIATTLADVDSAVGVADGLTSLSLLKHPGCAAAIHPRRLPSNVQTWLDEIDPDTLPRGRIILPARMVAQAVQQLCDTAGIVRCEERDWFQSDIARLAEVFADLMSVGHLRLRLDVVETNACRKFHIDAVTARLVCTYRGSGTQYGISPDGGDPRDVFQVDTGVPILLRGTLWPGDPPSGLLHRSPPIEGTGETRLLLVLDPVFDPEEEA